MNKKYRRFINTLFVVAPMSLIMAFVGTTRHHGLAEGWGWKFLSSWLVMLPVALLAAFLIIPPAKWLAERVASK
jgi:sorbitol-specific phosphotransferase system component IIC